MAKIITFHLDVEPKAWKRTRLCGKRFFTDTASRSYRQKLLILSRLHVPRRPLLGALQLTLLFALKRPMCALDRDYPSVRPDLDNYAKAVMDAFNGVFWVDDAQVVKLSTQKMYMPGNPYIAVEMVELE